MQILVLTAGRFSSFIARCRRDTGSSPLTEWHRPSECAAGLSRFNRLAAPGKCPLQLSLGL